MAKVLKLNKNFTIVCNTWLKDTNLSAKAKGIICFLQSVNEDWEYSISGLATQFKDGYDSIKSGIDELVEAGYIEWSQTRVENGKFGDVDVRLREKPVREKADSGKSRVGEIGNNKELTITKNESKQKTTIPNGIVAKATEVVGEIVEPKSYGKTEINNLFNLWADTCGFEIKNKVQLNRFACQRLLKSRGENAIRAVIGILPETFDDRYAPTVKNFMDLEEKWDSLRLWYRKKLGRSQTRTEIKDGVKYTYNQNGDIVSMEI